MRGTHGRLGQGSRVSQRARRLGAAVAEPLEPRRLLTAISSGQSITSTISPAAEVETYTFSGTAGGSAIVTVAETGANTGFTPLLKLYTPANLLIAQSSGSIGTSVSNFSLPATGTYKVTVQDYYAHTSAPFRITAATFPAAQQTGGDAGPISSGQTKAARIDLGDLDVFTFSGTAGGSAIVTAAETGGNSGFTPLVELFSPKGVRLGASSGSIGTSVSSFALPQTGTYYAVVRDYYASTAANYNVTVASLGGAQQTGGDAGPISSGQTKSAKADLGDLDVFTFSGKAGGSAIVTAAETGGNGSFTPLVELFGPNGVRLAASSGSIGASVSNYALPTTGTYYAVVRDYYATTAANYNVTVASLGGTQQTGGDAGPINSGQTKAAKIDTGDLDVFTFNGTAGASAEVAAGEATNSSFTPLVELFSPAGVRLAASSGSIGTSVSNFALPTTGTYYAVVRDYYATTAANYSVTVVSVPGSQDAGGDAGFLPSGVTRNAKITTGDKDVHPFYAVVGDKLVLTTSETGVATAFTPLVELFDPSGKRIAATSGSVTAGVTINSAAKSGVYYYVVSDYYASTPGSYSTKLVETPSATKPTISVAATHDATEGGANGSFVITRTNIRALPVTVNFTLGGTAKNGVDYTSIPLTVTIPANAGSVTVLVKPVNDTLKEGDETVTLTLGSGTAYNLDSLKKTATLKLHDNDVTVAIGPATAASATDQTSAWAALDESSKLDALLKESAS